MPDFAFDNCLIYTIFCKSYLKTATSKKSLFLSSGGHTYFYSFFSFLFFFSHFYLQYLPELDYSEYSKFTNLHDDEIDIHYIFIFTRGESEY